MIANKTRSFVKAISWRILASADTFLISYVYWKTLWAGSITLLEIITKTVLYYLHERGWIELFGEQLVGNKYGGESEIELTNELPVAGFQDRCFQPLSHLSHCIL